MLSKKIKKRFTLCGRFFVKSYAFAKIYCLNIKRAMKMTKSEYHKEEIIQKYDNKNKFHNTKINRTNKKYVTAM